MTTANGAASHPRFDAVIFDFDGVIADTERVQLDAWHAASKAMGVDAKDLRLIDTAGRRDIETAARLAGPDPARRQALWDDKLRRVDEWHARNGVRAVPGAADFVRALARHGLPAAIASNSAPEVIEPILRGMGLEGCVKAVVTADRALPKPDPDVYLRAVAVMGLAAARCLAVEDSLVGLAAARAAGCTACALVDEESRGWFAGQLVLVASSFAEISRMVFGD